MTKISDEFEKQIKKIHDIIEQKDAVVTWDDRIPDPDNPEQPRQIDVTVRKDDKLTIIECRIHKEPQDVTWIEHLMGRRTSLCADAVIGVSASGFTKGAIEKAKNHGIILRDIISLTEEEIDEWGLCTDVTLVFYQYKNTSIRFSFDKTISPTRRLSPSDLIGFFAKEPLRLNDIFNAVSEQLEKQNKLIPKIHINCTLRYDSHLLLDQQVKRIFFETHFDIIEMGISTPSVVAYDEPGIDALERNVFVEKVGVGEFEITKSRNSKVAMVIDLYPIETPLNCQYRGIKFDFKKSATVQMRKLEILRPPKKFCNFGKLRIGVSYLD